MRYRPAETFPLARPIAEGDQEIGISPILGTARYLPPPRFTISPDVFRISLETWDALGMGPEAVPVLDAIRKHGHVTTAMVARQLKVSQDTAQRLVNKLVESGLIERAGAARATRYILKGA